MDQRDLTAQALDLTNCDREPIHIPGSIQPHGLLLVLTEPDLTITQISNNTFDWLGLQPLDLLGKSLEILLDAPQINQIRACLSADFENFNPLKLSLRGSDQPRLFDGILHRSDQLLILELEPSQSHQDASFFDFYHLVKGSIVKMQQAATLPDLCQVIVKEVRKLTGFDRVMLYRFDTEGAGTVIAEDKLDDLNPYLDLRYPQNDVPKQAKQLYILNLLRLIPQAKYQAVALVPETNLVTDQPLDLSQSFLRSVSPIHLEYLSNMGVAASMSISLVRDQKLWGLIACHHQSPKFLSYEVRTACEFLGQVMALELTTKEDNANLDYKMKLKLIQSKFVESISAAETFVDGIVESEANLLDLVNAQGAVVCLEDHLITIGKTPATAEIKALIAWVETQIPQEVVFHTACLPKLYPPAEHLKANASGLLALAISKVHRHYILWFRPEVVQTVNWGGNPDKTVEVTADGSVRLSPRKSFERWEETVRDTALPWQQCEIDAALELRSAVIGIVLRKVDELAKINIELERSNDELDAFAYIASHDLKEPLRGIHNYSSFLIEDYAALLTEEGVSKLQTLVRLTQRMEDLIESLLHFSRLGRVELSMQPTDLNELVQGVIDVLRINLQQAPVDIQIPRPLPTIRCDRIQVSEVFSNLLSNAIKYSDKLDKQVEIGWFETAMPIEAHSQEEQPPALVFYIRDNGIGIRQKHQEAVFRIFKRLHGRNKYGGGTGAGLTIAKKIVERHNGKIWVESTYGEGSSFYFTLPG